jgi:ankyrin repeat protein
VNSGNVSLARRLLNAGADPNRPDSVGATPITCAEGRGHAAMVDLLLSYVKTNAPAEEERL